MDEEWQPANELESTMMAALRGGHGRRFVLALRKASLCLPNAEHRVPDSLPPLEENQTMVFTSPDALNTVYREAVDYREVDFEALRAELGDDHQLVLSPNTPIGVVLHFRDVEEIARGNQQLASMREVEDSIIDQTMEMVRNAVLADLGSDSATAQDAITPSSQLNELESGLVHCVEDGDFETFMLTLVNSDVVMPLTGPPSDGASVAEMSWLVLGEEQSPVIPVFSSTEVLEWITSRVPHHARIPFLDVLLNWPSEEHLLYFNPGTATEFPLIGPAIKEILAGLAQLMPEQ